MKPRLLPLFTLAALAVAAFSLTGCGYQNAETPAGYVGYVTQGAVFGSTSFVKLQTGPTSSGLGFLYHVVNVSVTPYTFDETFSVEHQTGVLAKDQLAVSFDLHLMFRIKPDRVRDFVEKYTTLTENESPDVIVTTAYNNFVKQPARSYARGEVEKYNGLSIQENIGAITTDIRRSLEESLHESPFEILNVVVGNIQYPPNVTKAVAEKIAAQQDLLRQETILQITIKQANQAVETAKGIANSMALIQQKLTPEYIQYEAIKAQLAMVNSPNHTTIYIPVGPMGVPIVNTTGGKNEEPAPLKP